MATTVPIGTFERFTQEDTTSALAALYSYESQQPEVSRQKMDGLRQHYGVRTRKALAYSDVHAVLDMQHCRGERDALARCLGAGLSGDDLLRAAGYARQAYWQLLNGICEEAGIPASC